ncbi:MAG: hypothetical protein HQRvContig05_35 [Haloquadratum phage sp.]|nr:MAG: hypothetical protein HQRvContig05_35 [Haloquadratum phage sp.]
MQDLSNIHDDATEVVNIPGTTSPILEISPDNGLYYEILNAAARGSEPGVPVYAKLYDADGNLLPLGTSLRFEFEAPGDDERNKVSEVRDNIQPFNTLSISEQQDEEFIDAVKIPLLGRMLRVRDIDTFYVSINSSEEIDWSASQLFIEGSAVNEGN